mgnify:CR=1 FL=1
MEFTKNLARVSALAKDITEYLAGLDLSPVNPTGMTIAYHSACSMQHGQKITRQPKELLVRAGFVVREPREGHLCCGSAGTYSVLQPELSKQLREMEVAGLVARTVYPVVPPRVDYSLTPLGRSLEPVIQALGRWGQENLVAVEDAALKPCQMPVGSEAIMRSAA